MERFTKIVNGLKTSIIIAKHSNLDVWQGSEYTSEMNESKINTEIYRKLDRFAECVQS